MVKRVSPSSKHPTHPQDSHGGDVLSWEGVGGVADEKAGLAHSSERQEVPEDRGHKPCPRCGEVSMHLPSPPSPALREDPGPPLWLWSLPSEDLRIRVSKPKSRRVTRSAW